MLHLAGDTSPQWVAMASEQLDLLLLDHAHCEKKAASTAMNMIFRYGDDVELVKVLSPLAREELEHFELVLGVLEARGVPWRRLEPSAYAGKLMGAVRKEEPDRFLDTLLVCSLIEARSCERMKLLAEHLPEPELAELYRGLLASEARHHHVYVDLALRIADRDTVFARLDELAAHEASVLMTVAPDVRMHS